MKYLKNFLLILVFVTALIQRIDLIGTSGQDFDTYKRALDEFIDGTNPYEWTVRSYNRPNDPWNHGFAYLPGLLYTYLPFYLTSLTTEIPASVLIKIPTLLADFGIGILLYKTLKNKNYYILLLGLVAWLFNPYIQVKQLYTYSDPIPILFMLLGLYFIEKDDVLSGTFYALSIALKTFPVILFPIFIFKSKDKIKFTLSGVIIAVAVSIPFMKSIGDFVTYLNGALLVHGDRAMQGRPFLFYISYYYKIELFQIIPTKIYTYIAMFSGMFVTTFLLLKIKLKDKYLLSTLAFLPFYTFTPVLNRTYLLWFMPLLIITLANIFKSKKAILYTLSLGGFYSFYFWYLGQWKDGFHIWHP